jgi:hypothetical protein
MQTVHHEALHVATYLCDKCGIPISYSNDEVLTHLQDHIVKLIVSTCYPEQKHLLKYTIEPDG